MCVHVYMGVCVWIVSALTQPQNPFENRKSHKSRDFHNLPWTRRITQICTHMHVHIYVCAYMCVCAEIAVNRKTISAKI